MASTFRWSGGSAGFWGARAGYTLGYARGNNSGAALANNNFQLLAEKNLDLNDGPLDTDRRHNLTLNGRMEVPRTEGLTVSALFRFMSGRPFSIIDTNVDADRNGILFDPLPAGTYSGDRRQCDHVWRTRAVATAPMGRLRCSWMPRFGYRLRMGGARTLDLFAEVLQPDRPVELHEPVRRPAAGNVPRTERSGRGRVPAATAARHAAGF